MDGMTVEQLRELLKNNEVARAKYTASAIRFFEDNGIKVTEQLIKNFDDEAIKAVLGGGGGSTNVIAIFAS